MKSSNVFCLFRSMPPRCHDSPYSLPPRRFATTYTPPRSSHGNMFELNAGLKDTWKPPYPVRIAGALPSRTHSFDRMMNSGMRVPSFDTANS